MSLVYLSHPESTLKPPSIQTLNQKQSQSKKCIDDEWQILLKHQHEIYDAIARYDRDLKHLQQYELERDYTEKMKEHVQEKQMELLVKKKEAELMNLKIEHSKIDIMQQKRDQAMIQKHLAESYAKSIISKQEYLHMLKAEEIKEEQQRISDINKQMELLKQIKIAEQELYQNIAQNELKRAEEKQQKELKEKLKNKLEHQELMLQNEAKEYVKELNYKNFYKLAEENQRKLQAMHEKLVLTPNLRKEKEAREIIEKRVKNEQYKQFQNEIEKQKAHQEMLRQTRNVIESQIGRKSLLKGYEREEKDKRIHERLLEGHDYEEYQKSSKIHQHEYQKNYKECLDKQQLEERDLFKPNKMTLEEKRMNYFDPQAYKVNDPRTFALIPGLLSSKYSGPFRNQKSLPQRYPVRPINQSLDLREGYIYNGQNKDESNVSNQSVLPASLNLQIDRRQSSLPRLDQNTSFAQDVGNKSPEYFRRNKETYHRNIQNSVKMQSFLIPEMTSPTKGVHFPVISPSSSILHVFDTASPSRDHTNPNSLQSHGVGITSPSRLSQESTHHQSFNEENVQNYPRRERNMQRRGISRSNIFQY